MGGLRLELEHPAPNRYLSFALPGQRMDALAAAIAFSVRSLPLSDASVVGLPIPVKGIQQVASLAAGTLEQDAAITVAVARTSASWCSQLAPLLGGSFTEGVETLFRVNGIRWSGGEVAIDTGDSAWLEVDMQVAVARVFGSVLLAVVLGPGAAPPDDWAFFEHLHSNCHTPETRSIALDVAAFATIGIARLINGGRIDVGRANPVFPVFNDRYRRAPRLTGAGWYPDPVDMGLIRDGEASLQRYWDGRDWTTRIRYLDRGRRRHAVAPYISVPLEALGPDGALPLEGTPRLAVRDMARFGGGVGA